MEKSYEPSSFASLAFQVRILATAHDVIKSTQKIFDRLLAWIPLANPANVVEDGSVAGLPNGIRCTNGQHTERKSVHTFPLKEKDRKRHQAWVRFRPK